MRSPKADGKENQIRKSTNSSKSTKTNMNATAINVFTAEALGMKKIYFQPLKVKNL